jgi:hypothetical protein
MSVARTYEEIKDLEETVIKANALATAFGLLLAAASESIVHHKMNGRACYIMPMPDWQAIRELGDRLVSDVVAVETAFFGDVACGARYP